MDIWIWDLVSRRRLRRTFDAADDRSPLWTVDGKRIAFVSNRDKDSKIYWRAADGTGKDEALGSTAGVAPMPCAWSRDGKTMVVTHLPESFKLGGDIGVLSMEGDHKYRPLLNEVYSEVQPRISPDGRWIAYASDEGERYEVYVCPFPEVGGGRWQVSTSGGDSPLWSPDGRELFYRSDDAVMAVSVHAEPTFSVTTPIVLFRGAYFSPSSAGLSSLSNGHYSWDISPDGRRFLMIKLPVSMGAAPAAENPRKINVVLNWFEELKQRVPVK
jgi:Tol biopolymer transport system component